MSRPCASAEAIPRYVIYRASVDDAGFDAVHVETITDRWKLHDWTIEPHRHADVHQLMFWTTGRGLYRLDDEVAAFTAPALMVTPAGAVHSFDLEPGSDAVVVTVTDGFLREALAGAEPFVADLLRTALILDLDPSDVAAHGLDRQVAELVRAHDGHAVGRRAALGAYLRLIAVGIARIGACPPHTAGAPLVVRFRQLVERHYRGQRRLAAYAAELAVTPGRLNAACREAIGQSAMDVVHGRRLIEAKRLLLYSTMTVADIAYHTGFEDPAYFSRFFARRAGVSPQTYRSRRAAPA